MGEWTEPGVFIEMGQGPVVGSVIGCDLVDPGAELANLNVHSWCAHIAVAGAPGNNTNKHPGVTLLADKRASGVTLRGKQTGEVSLVFRACRIGQCHRRAGSGVHLAGGGT